jgi:large subunit ribosomal protein L16
MLQPKKVKYRRPHRPKRRGQATGNSEVHFGDYGIQAITRSYVTDRQIESARIAISRHVKRGGKLWINIFPDRSLTKKPLETRMGKGKGSPESWVANVKPGNVIFEIAGVSHDVAKGALTRAIHKLPVKAKIISRGGED